MGGHSILPLELPKLDVPTVSFRIVNDDPFSVEPAASLPDQLSKLHINYGYNSFSPWVPPTSYIRWHQPAEEELDRRCEYDMDEQDQEWLNILNADRKRVGQEPVTCELLEIVMDRLEKEWFHLSRKVIQPDANLTASEDSRCAICEDADTENSNAIVFCDGCNLAVHQDCYGVPYIPEGQWLCRKCTVSPDRPVTCQLCPNLYGAFKQTTENEWAHLICAIHVPETSVGNAMYMEPIDGIRCIPKQRWKLKCYICRKSGGACIQCANRNCFTAYHPTCAQEFGLYLKLKLSSAVASKTSTRGADDHLNGHPSEHSLEGANTSRSFCDKHTPIAHIEALQSAAKARTSIPKDFIPVDSSPNTPTNTCDNPSAEIDHSSSSEGASHRLLAMSPKKINTLQDLRTLRLLATGSQSSKSARAYRKTYFSGPPLVPELIFQRVCEYLSKLRCAQKKLVISMICTYWSLKREARRGAPLLKRLHLEPWTAATPAIHSNIEDRRRRFDLLVRVRHDLQQVKNLSAILCKREKVKLRKADLIKEVIEQAILPGYSHMRRVLSAAMDVDKQKYFLHPVLAADVPDYHEIIKHPMDWMTIQRKLDAYEYFCLPDFISDIQLTLTNARLYNHHSTPYHKAAIRVAKALEPYLRDLLATEPPSALAGPNSDPYPNSQQRCHFFQVSSLLQPQHLEQLLRPPTPVNVSFPRTRQRSHAEGFEDLPARSHSAGIEIPEEQPTVQSPFPAPDCSDVVTGDTQCDHPRRSPELRQPTPLSLKLTTQEPTAGSESTLETDTSTLDVANVFPHKHSTSGTTSPKTKKRARGNEAAGSEKSRVPRMQSPKQLQGEALIGQQISHPTSHEFSLKLHVGPAATISECEGDVSGHEKVPRRRAREKTPKKHEEERFETPQDKLLADEQRAAFDRARAIDQLPPQLDTPRPLETIESPSLAACSIFSENSTSSAREPGIGIVQQPETARIAPKRHVNELSSVEKAEKGLHLASQTLLRPENGILSPSNFSSLVAAPGPEEQTSIFSDTPNKLVVHPEAEEVSSRPSTIEQNRSTAHADTSPPIPTPNVNFGRTEVVPRLTHPIQQRSTFTSDEIFAALPPAATSCYLGVAANSSDLGDQFPQDGMIPGEPRGSVSPVCSAILVRETEPSRVPSSGQTDEIGDPRTQTSLFLGKEGSLLVVEKEANQLVQQVHVEGRGKGGHNESPSNLRCSPRAGHRRGLSNESGSASAGKFGDSSFNLLSMPTTGAPLEDPVPQTCAGASVSVVKVAAQSAAQALGGAEAAQSASIFESVEVVRSPSNTCRTPYGVSPTVNPEHQDISNKALTALEAMGQDLGLTSREKSSAEAEAISTGDIPMHHRSNAADSLLQLAFPPGCPAEAGPKPRIKVKLYTPEFERPPPRDSDDVATINLSPQLAAQQMGRKLRLILDAPHPNLHDMDPLQPAPATGSSAAPRTPASSKNDKFHVKSGLGGSPEFVTDLPGNKDSFRLFNTGYILPQGTRRRATTPAAHSECFLRSSLEPPHSPPARQKKRKSRVLDPGAFATCSTPKPSRNAAVRTAGTNPHLERTPTPKATEESCNTSAAIVHPWENQRNGRLFPPTVEDGSSELSDIPSSMSSDVQMVRPLVASCVEKDDKPPAPGACHPVNPGAVVEPPVNLSAATSNSKSKSKKPKRIRAQHEEDLEYDPNGFRIYPKAIHSTSRYPIHNLARRAFLRLGEVTRLPLEGPIEDGTLVWAKVAGHNWFPAEVGLPDDPMVPPLVLQRFRNSKADNQVLVMFFDSQRSWQCVARHHTRYLGENQQLDALLASDAYVLNRSKLQEIREAYAFACSNIALPEDVAAEEAARAPLKSPPLPSDGHGDMSSLSLPPTRTTRRHKCLPQADEMAPQRGGDSTDEIDKGGNNAGTSEVDGFRLTHATDADCCNTAVPSGNVFSVAARNDVGEPS